VRTVFADTAYWVASFGVMIRGAPRLVRAIERLGAVRPVTIDEVLVEFLAAVAGADHRIRSRAGPFVRSLLSSPDVVVQQQSRESLLLGLRLYEARPDKGYSLVAMTAMRAAGTTQVLTTDRHFEQEGFALLMKR
jgi:predicted nucleic acid-binding protein